MRLFTRSLLAASALALPASMASAATFTETFNFDHLTTEFTTDTYTFKTFAQQLAAANLLGNLTGVAINYSYTAEMGGTLTNAGGNAVTDLEATENAAIGYYFTGAYASPAAPTPFGIIPSGVPKLTISQTQSYASVAANSSVVFDDFSDTKYGAINQALLNVSNFNATALKVFAQTRTTFSQSSAGGSVSGNLPTTGSGYVTLTYTYDAIQPEPEPDPEPGVPEPASWAMMVGGFGLLGASMRRRKTQTVFG